jgi:hypothetical protein
MAVFRNVVCWVLGSAFVVTLLATIVQNHRLSAELRVMVTTFADRWNDFKAARQ